MRDGASYGPAHGTLGLIQALGGSRAALRAKRGHDAEPAGLGGIDPVCPSGHGVSQKCIREGPRHSFYEPLYTRERYRGARPTRNGHLAGGLRVPQTASGARSAANGPFRGHQGSRWPLHPPPATPGASCGASNGPRTLRGGPFEARSEADLAANSVLLAPKWPIRPLLGLHRGLQKRFPV